MKNYGLEYVWLDRPRAKKALSTVYDFLESNGVRAWIDFGTLLGAYREGEFIAYDYDVDMGIMYEDYKKIQDLRIKIPKEIAEAGIIFGGLTIGPNKTPLMMAASVENIKIDIYCWFRKGEFDNLCYFWNKDKAKFVVYKFPKQYHENLRKIKLIDREYYGPADTDNYLKFVYGDNWNTRIKTGHALGATQEYMSIEKAIPKDVLEELP